MAPTPRNRTPLRRSTRVSSPAKESIVVDTTPRTSRQAVESTPPSQTPETRKRKIDFYSLHNYGFQGAPPSTPKPPNDKAPITKKPRVSAAEKALNAAKEMEATIQELQSENEDDLDREKKKPSGKHAWWQKFYNIKTLTTTYEKGRGRNKTKAFDEKYTCTLCQDFYRLASKLGTSTSAISNHIEINHKRREDKGEATNQVKQTGIGKYLKGKKQELPEFKKAMVDQIIDTCQPFTVTESQKFKVMIRSVGYGGRIVKGDVITNQVAKRLVVSKKDLISLLERTYTTVTISLDRWTSTNNLSMFAMNSKQAGPDIKIYQAYFDFIKIKGAYLGKNLAKIVFSTGKKLGILQKIITLTRDNAKNNDTCARHLHKIIEYLYDNHLDLMPVYYKEIRFKGEQSLIDCLAHVDNLIYKAILESLGSSTHKEASEFLDRVRANRQKNITMLIASGDIAVLRVIVLQVNKSP